MSKLQAGKKYLTRGGDEVTLEESVDSDKCLVGIIKGFRIQYAKDGSGIALNSAASHADIVDMVDTVGETLPQKVSLEVGKWYETKGGESMKAVSREEDMWQRFMLRSTQGSSFYYLIDGTCVSAEGMPLTPAMNIAKEVPAPAPMPNILRDDDPIHPQGDEENEAPDMVNAPSSAPLLHEDLFQAVLRGETVQWKKTAAEPWEDLRNRAFALRMLALSRGTSYQFRKKPQTRVLWGIISDFSVAGFGDEETARSAATLTPRISKVLRIEVDDELNVISARSEKP